MTSQQDLSRQLVEKAEASVLYDEHGNQVVREGYTSMGVPYDWDDHLFAIRRWVGGYTLGSNKNKSIMLPRYGLLSLLANMTTIHLYDNPVMNNLCQTAFTDGMSVYINLDFYKGLVGEGQADPTVQYGPVLLIMHELMHKMRRHVDRHAHLDPDIRNMAEDRNINATIALAYPDLKWPAMLKEVGLGFGSGEMERFAEMSEEAHYSELLRQMGKALKGSGGGSGNKKGKGSGSGSSSSGGGAGGSGEPGDGEGEVTFGEPGDHHTVTTEELIKALQDANMNETLKRLGLPSKEMSQEATKEKLERMRQKSDQGRVEAINKALDQAREAERRGIQYPGSAVLHGAMEMIKAERRSEMNFELAFQDVIFKEGNEDHYIEDDEPDEIYYVEPVTEMLGNPLYHGITVQRKRDSVVLVVLDASGSVSSQENLPEAMAAIFKLKQCANQFEDSATEVLVVMGDVSVAGGVEILDEDNWEEKFNEGVARKCAGGTDLQGVLNQAFAMKEIKDRTIKGAIMFTDSYDTPPRRKNMPNIGNDCSLVYAIFSTTGTGDVEKFRRAVSDEAQVVQVGDKTTVDLVNSNPDALKEKPSRSRPRMR